MSPTFEPSRLRDLRLERGWTQQELADRLSRLFWIRHPDKKHCGINGDMVSKWERGAKGISRTYQALLCELLGVTPDQLGFAVPGELTPGADASLLSLLDTSAGLLDQLGSAADILAPQMLTVWRDDITGRRTLFALVDPAATEPTAKQQSAPVKASDLDQLAGRLQALYATAAPAALLTAVAAHVRTVGSAIRRTGSAVERRRLQINRARVALLAGRLATEDLGNLMAGRAYYSLAAEAAKEAGDNDLTAAAQGWAAQLAARDGQPRAALAQLVGAPTSLHPAVASWLATIEARINADTGDHSAAGAALTRASRARSTVRPVPGWFDQPAAGLPAATGHIHLAAGDYEAARPALTEALSALSVADRRMRTIVLVDIAAADLGVGDHHAAARHASAAAKQLDQARYATGIAALRTLLTHAPRVPAFQALRDQHAALVA